MELMQIISIGALILILGLILGGIILGCILYYNYRKNKKLEQALKETLNKNKGKKLTMQQAIQEAVDMLDNSMKGGEGDGIEGNKISGKRKWLRWFKRGSKGGEDVSNNPEPIVGDSNETPNVGHSRVENSPIKHRDRNNQTVKLYKPTDLHSESIVRKGE